MCRYNRFKVSRAAGMLTSSVTFAELGTAARVVPHTPDTAEALAVHEQIMAEVEGVFRALAQ